MKKLLITITMMLALGAAVDAVAQKHRHTPQVEQELVDSTSQDAVEVYSDTTSATQSSHKGTVSITTKTSPWSSTTKTFDIDTDEDVDGTIHSIFSQLDAKDITGMIFILGILLIIFVLAPILIIIALFYFINKNRKQKIKLAQMAMEQGQPIPDQLLEERNDDVADEYQKGMRQCFVGVGLMIFLGLVAGVVGFGIGALVFCIGLGKVFVSKTAGRRQDDLRNDLRNNQF